MNYRLIPFLFFIVLAFSIGSCTPDDSCPVVMQTGLMDGKMKGMTLVAAQDPIQNDPLSDLKAIGVDWVAVVPYAFYIPGNPYIDTMSTCPEPTCVYGPGTAMAAKFIMDNPDDMKIMLKPQLWAENEWVGDLSFDTEAQWDSFETNYTDFILNWAQEAENHRVQLFCIGTEIKNFVIHRPNYWRNLIPQIRQIYMGEITYASNWDDYHLVQFWDLLDYIGVDAYFPLNQEETPTVCELKDNWQPIVQQLKSYSNQEAKPILFTEFGYLSMDAPAYNTWQLEHKKGITAVNEQAQANAVQALLEVFALEDWWGGGFQWKWYADAISASCEEDVTKDYTPENKMAEIVLKTMYE